MSLFPLTSILSHFGSHSRCADVHAAALTDTLARRLPAEATPLSVAAAAWIAYKFHMLSEVAPGSREMLECVDMPYVSTGCLREEERRLLQTWAWHIPLKTPMQHAMGLMKGSVDECCSDLVHLCLIGDIGGLLSPPEWAGALDAMRDGVFVHMALHIVLYVAASRQRSRNLQCIVKRVRRRVQVRRLCLSGV